MEVITPEEAEIKRDELKKRILKGELFIYPTDTIYGIGCNALNSAAVKKIREVKALIIESLYADLEGKTPSEQEAKEMLEKLLMEKQDKKGIIISTFSSHISRLKAIVEIGKKM